MFEKILSKIENEAKHSALVKVQEGIVLTYMEQWANAIIKGNIEDAKEMGAEVLKSLNRLEEMDIYRALSVEKSHKEILSIIRLM